MLNYREIDALLAELHLEGSWLRKVRQPDFCRIILEFSSQNDLSALVLVMAPPYPRLHLLADSRKLPRALAKPPRFTAVLKSRLEGARLSSVSQIGHDRIIRFSFLHSGKVLNLDAKLWGNSANIILSGSDGIIIDAYSRRPKQGESPGEAWPPEGIGNGEAPSPERFPIRQLPGGGSWNRRVENYYRELESQRSKQHRMELWEAHLNRREAALKIKEERMIQNKVRFENQLKDGHRADIIMAHLHEMEKGAETLKAEDWESPGSQINIPLDTKLIPRENAEKYYRRQKRAVRGLKKLEEDRLLL
ncbi:MAG: NFACT family protein, partial [Spirochaetaceae bacterium]|nr:NFACT family protein [Spirochaetaceae bacterium]